MADAKLPAFHFYPGDWLRDPVSGCSLAAQGLWLRMMFIAHDSTRYGYLEINGSAMQPEHVAARCGTPLAQYETLLSELVASGIPSINEAGIIYSRRMVNDAKLRAVRAKAGRKGGKAPRSNAEANIKQNTDNDNDNDHEFELFWTVFPRGRKKSKARAREAFEKARCKAPTTEIIAAATEYAASAEGRGQYVKMPETWLNGECWNDDREAWKHKETSDGRQRTFGPGQRHDPAAAASKPGVEGW